MNAINEIQAHNRRYFSTVDHLMKNLKLGDGLFGLGNDPKKDPCHMAYYEAIAATLSHVESQPLAEGELDEIVSCVLRMDKEHAQQSEMVRLMLQAVQGLTLPLIPRLSRDCAQELGDWYAHAYPRQSRMPNQSKVLRALNRRAGKSLLHR